MCSVPNNYFPSPKAVYKLVQEGALDLKKALEILPESEVRRVKEALKQVELENKRKELK